MTESSPATTNARPLAIGGLVCSIIGLLVFGIILGPIGAALGFVAKKRGEGGLATAALVIGVIAFVLSVLALVGFAVLQDT